MMPDNLGNHQYAAAGRSKMGCWQESLRERSAKVHLMFQSFRGALKS
jgi:hypothetical protein